MFCINNFFPRLSATVKVVNVMMIIIFCIPVGFQAQKCENITCSSFLNIIPFYQNYENILALVCKILSGCMLPLVKLFTV